MTEKNKIATGKFFLSNQVKLYWLLALPLSAQAAAPPDIGAGSILQQIRPQAAPSPSPAGPEVSIKREGGEKLPESAPILIKRIIITGNHKIDTGTLHGLVADSEGKELTLAQLNQLAARITGYYREHGYPLARAIVPAQTIHDGAVTIEVIEAGYGKIKLDNRSRVNDTLFKDALASLKSGATIEQQPMDQALLMLSDIPGVEVNATLMPGEKIGSSDLVVIAEPAPYLSGNLALDNYGNKYTGRDRLGATVSISNPLHHGDVLSFSGLSSGAGMNYGRASYDAMLNSMGTQLGGSVSALKYTLGSTLASINGHGTAQVLSVWAKQPFIRSREVNLYGQLEYDNSRLKDHIDASSIMTDRHLDNWTANFSGDSRKTDSANTWSLSLTSGRLGFDSNAAQLVDAATAKTEGIFFKWNLNLSRLQSLGGRNALYAALSAQGANSNLDASQKMVAGGPYTVRAYNIGALSGDAGYLGTVELRHHLSDNWQVVAFLDSEHVIVNRTTWIAGSNSATLSGAGLGANWAGLEQWSVKAYAATRIGTASTLVAASSSSRLWVQIAKGF